MTLRNSMIIIAATLSLAAAPPQAKSPAPAPPAPTAPTKPTPRPTTIGCILASNVFVQREPDATKKALAGQTLAFYLGRLNPSTTAPQLKAALKTSADTLKGVDAAGLMNECLVDLRTKAQLLQTVGQQIQQGK
jgi:hypothetical protein